MKDQVKAYAKIGLVAVLKWVFGFGLGLVLSAAVLITVILTTAKYAAGPHTGGATYFIQLWSNDSFAFILLVSVPIFIWLYFMLTNKSIIKVVANSIWKKDGELIIGKVNEIATNIVDRYPKIQEVVSAVKFKRQMRKEVKAAHDLSKYQEMVVKFVLKKLSISDQEFGESKDVPELLTNKFSAYISDFIQPSNNLYWMCFGVHLIGFVIWLAY